MSQYTYKIKYNRDYNEYSVRYYKDKVFLGEAATYYTDDKADAKDTAEYQIKRYEQFDK